MPEEHVPSASKVSESNAPSGTPLPDEERHGASDADVNFASTTGSDLTSGNESGDEITGQRPIARDDYTTGDSTVGQPVDDSTGTTAR